MLGEKAEALCEHLLPNGKKEGNQWKAGSIQGEAGKSLSVDLNGGKGFNDFADEPKGNYIDLWMQTQAMDFKQAFDSAKKWLGVYEQQPVKSFSKPKASQAQKPIASNVETFITDRGLTKKTIQDFKITQDSVSVPANNGQWQNVEAIRFDYWQDNEVIHVKFKYFCKYDKKFKWWASAKTKRVLFGWHLIPNNYVESVVITEGEFDAMAYHQMGIYALSVPNGGGDEGKQDWIIYDYERLSRFDTIYISMDMDEVGFSAIKTLVDRLGIDRCKIVELPHKDANECLKKGATEQDFKRYLKDAKYQSIDEVKQLSDFKDEILEFMYDNQEHKGFETPWSNINEAWTVRPGELTLVNGINNHGKSEFANQIAVHLSLKLGLPTFIASMEHQPKKLGRNIIKQAIGTESNPSRLLTAKVIEQSEDKIFISNFDHTLKPEKVLEVINYVYRRFGVRFVVIDSLMKCGIDGDNYNQQKEFVNALFSLTRKFNLHILLVVHPRKGMDETKIPSKMDVAGSGDITNVVDNLFTVWRNKEREDAAHRQEATRKADPSFADKLNQALNAANPTPEQYIIKRDQEKIDNSSPVVAALQKDRENGREQKFALDYRKSQHVPFKSPNNRHYITLESVA